MPHIVLEYSADLDPVPDLRHLFEEIHGALERIADAPIGNSKSRARSVDTFIADGSPAHAMVHLDIRLMEGRSDDTKAELSRACLDILTRAFERAADSRALQTTVAIEDLDRATYAKDPEGTIR